MATERLVINIDGDATGFRAELRRTDGSISQFETRVNRATRTVQAHTKAQHGMAESFRSTVVGLSSLQTLFYQYAFFLGGITTATIKAAAETERLIQLFRGLSKEMTTAGKNREAVDNFKYILDLSTKAPFGIDTLSNAFVKLYSGLKDLDKAKGGLQALTDSVAKFGGSGEALSRASMAVQQMAGKGVVSMEELRQQLGEHIPDAAEKMAASLGLTMGQLAKVVSEGKVKALPALEGMFRQMERGSAGSAAAMMNTYNGLFEQLKTSFSNFARAINGFDEDAGAFSDTGFFGVIKQQVIELTTFLNSAEGATFGRQMADGMKVIVTALVDLIKFMYQYRDVIIQIAKYALIWTVLRTGASTLMGLARAWVAATVAMRAYTASTFVTGGAIRTVIGTFGSLLMSIRSTSDAVTVLKWSFSALVGTTAGFAAVAAGAIAALAALAYGAWRLTDGLRAAANAQNALNGAKADAAVGNIVDQKTMDERKRSLDSLTDSIARNKKILAEKDPNKKALVTTNEGNTQMTTEQLKAHIAAQEALRNKLAANQITNERNRQNAVADATISNIARQNDRVLQSHLQGIQNRYNKEQEAIRAGRDKGLKDKAYWDAEQLKLDTKTDKARVAVLDSGIASLTAKLAKLRGAQKEGAEKVISDWTQERNRIEQLQKGVVAQADYMGAPKDTSGAAASKANAIENQQDALADLIFKNNQLKAEMAGNLDEFNAEAEAQQNAAQATANLTKEKYGLADAIRKERDANVILGIQAKTYRAEQKERLKYEGKLSDLHQIAADQEMQAAEALGVLNDAYNKTSIEVDRYIAKLKEKYKAELDSSAPQWVQDKANADLEKAASNFRIEAVAREAAAIKRKREAIEESYMTEEQLRQKNYQDEVQVTEALIAEAQKIHGPEGIRIVAEYYRYLDQLRRDNKYKQLGAFGDWLKDAQDWRGNMEESMGGIMGGFIDDLAAGKASFKSFATSIIKSLVAIIIKALIAKAILAALGMSGPAVSSDPGLYQYQAAGGTVAHTGGILGQSALPKRNVDPATFAFAQRYHTGGLVGLQKDEVPIIAQKGEGVFTKEQMKAMGGGGQSANVQVNVINQSSNDVKAEQSEPRFDGEQFVVDVVLKNATKPGPIRDMLQGLKNG